MRNRWLCGILGVALAACVGCSDKDANPKLQNTNADTKLKPAGGATANPKNQRKVGAQ